MSRGEEKKEEAVSLEVSLVGIEGASQTLWQLRIVFVPNIIIRLI